MQINGNMERIYNFIKKYGKTNRNGDRAPTSVTVPKVFA